MQAENFISLSQTSCSVASSYTTSSVNIAEYRNAGMGTASKESSIIGDKRPAISKTATSEDSRPKGRGRKGHTKSRVGCFNCKKARIKCKENRPSCDYCSHRNLKCEWPGLQICQTRQVRALIRKPTPNPILVPENIHTQGPVFTAQDFRLFNHFIRTAYPHHPPVNDSIWTYEIPSIASDYDFLLHSMLALSASDIAESNPSDSGPDLECVAISHRIKAISALNQAIGKPIASVAQGNAMIATCISLFFQSTLISAGLVEYMTFVRGVVVVAMHMGINGIDFLFKNMFNQAELVAEELNESRLIEPDLARRACMSLELCSPLVQNPKEKELHGHLLNSAHALLTSSKEAYTHLTKIYALFSYTMSHEEFTLFVDPSNEAGKLLQSHVSALQLIMTPFVRRQSLATRRRNATSLKKADGTTARWLEYLHRNITPEMMIYYEWPVWVQNEVEACRLTLSWDDADTPSMASTRV